MLRLENVKIYKDLTDDEVIKEACKKYKLDFKNVKKYIIYKKSIDARDKEKIFYNYTVDIDYSGNKNINNIKSVNEEEFNLNLDVKRKAETRPVIIGAGPAGLFCSLILIQNGIKPIIIEQGKRVEDRKKDVDEFLETGILKTNSNVQFGEGGAGTFSDGKLTTNSKNPLCRKVLKEFVNFGAPEQIMYINKPHIGTDNLINIIANMRNYIIKMGGTFLFEEKVVDFEIENNKIKSVITNKNQKIQTDSVVLAIGHSARDTIEKLFQKGINMEKKSFSVGVRIEHKQEMINNSQYGNKTKLKLPPAEYKLAYHGKERSCYTFCMCPGGVVIGSSSSNGEVVTNGMSKFARDEENANSALLVDITPEDFKGDSPLEGIYFQAKLEKKAFELGGNNFFAPIQRVEDFLNNKKTTEIGKIKPTYKPGVTFANLNELFPEYISQTLKEGILDFDKKIKGFANPDSILTAIESRSSSPVRILRDDNFESNIQGLYPCGEGVGYAGGIMTAAVDGIKCAIKLLEKE